MKESDTKLTENSVILFIDKSIFVQHRVVTVVRSTCQMLPHSSVTGATQL